MARCIVKIDLPVDIHQGAMGLVYATSPLIRGLLVTGVNEAEALGRVEEALKDIMEVVDNREGY